MIPPDRDTQEEKAMNIILNGRTVLVGQPGGLFPTTAGQVSYEDIVEWSGHGQGRILSVTYCTRTHQ
jgi:hypothetical protein